jgi:RNA polymerase sigma-70 factor (ECF subfamily)
VAVSTAEQQQVVERFLAAVRGGDVQALLDVLAPDVVAVPDGGGVVAAARVPVVGAERVARFLATIATRGAEVEAQPAWINGSLGCRVGLGGELGAAVSLTVADGRITHIYAIANPHKLSHLDAAADLART